MMTVIVVTNVKDAAKRIISALPEGYEDVDIITVNGDDWLSGEFRSTFLDKPVDLLLFDICMSTDIDDQKLLASASTMYEVGGILHKEDGAKTPVGLISTSEGNAISTVRQLAVHLLLLSTVVGDYMPTIASFDGYHTIDVDAFELFGTNPRKLAIINC